MNRRQSRISGRLRDCFCLPAAHWAIYIIVYFLIGTLMNQAGQWLQIARFIYWWQVITVYVCYMVPISLAFRSLPWWQQYLYGLFPMGLLELGGYSIHSSYAYPDNRLDQIFSGRNFSLAMTLFFAAYFPLLNALVERIRQALAAPVLNDSPRSCPGYDPRRQIEVGPRVRLGPISSLHWWLLSHLHH